MDEAYLKESIDRLESKLNAIVEHLGIVLVYSPEKYTVATKEDFKKKMEKEITGPMTIG